MVNCRIRCIIGALHFPVENPALVSVRMLYKMNHYLFRDDSSYGRGRAEAGLALGMGSVTEPLNQHGKQGKTQDITCELICYRLTHPPEVRTWDFSAENHHPPVSQSQHTYFFIISCCPHFVYDAQRINSSECLRGKAFLVC